MQILEDSEENEDTRIILPPPMGFILWVFNDHIALSIVCLLGPSLTFKEKSKKNRKITFTNKRMFPKIIGIWIPNVI